MAVYKKEFKTSNNNPNPFGGITSIIMLIGVLILGYILLKGIFTLLFWLSPILLIIGIALDPKGALNLTKSIGKQSVKNPLIPIVVVLLSALWFPVIPGVIVALAGLFLITKSVVKKKIGKVFNQNLGRQEKEEFVEYEEVVEEEESFLELPEITKEKQTGRTGNEYDNLFE